MKKKNVINIFIQCMYFSVFFSFLICLSVCNTLSNKYFDLTICLVTYLICYGTSIFLGFRNVMYWRCWFSPKFYDDIIGKCCKNVVPHKIMILLKLVLMPPIFYSLAKLNLFKEDCGDIFTENNVFLCYAFKYILIAEVIFFCISLISFIYFLYLKRKHRGLINELLEETNVNTICLICYTNNNTEWKILFCECTFHTNCVYKWLKNNNTCPQCRVIIVE